MMTTSWNDIAAVALGFTVIELYRKPVKLKLIKL